MTIMLVSSNPAARKAARTPRTRPWKAATGVALSAVLLAGSWVVTPSTTPASAVENEEYTYSQANHEPVGEVKNKPSIWFVYARAGETLAIAAGSHRTSGQTWQHNLERAFYTITGPTGQLVETNETTGGYPTAPPPRETGASMLEPATQPKAFVVPEGGEGIYRLALRGSNSNLPATKFPWRITVTDASGAEIPGRTWVETYRMVESWPGIGQWEVERDGLDLDYWFVSEQGYEYELKLNGFVGWTSIIEASLLGNTDENCVSLYHSVIEVESIEIECNDKYNIFFEAPAADLPDSAPIAVEDAGINTTQVGVGEMWVKPPIEEPVLTLAAFQNDEDPALPKKGTLNYSLSNFAGNYSIVVDADGDGVFDGPLDRKIPQSLTSAGSVGAKAPTELSFAFDGLDANGTAIPANVTAQISVLIEHFPELHFVFADVEQLAGGLSLTRTNGGGDPAADLVYWNDSVPSETPGDEPTLLGDQACGPADRVPSADNARNPIVNIEGMANLAEVPALRYWDTDLGSELMTQRCRDLDSPITGSYGNMKLLDTWSYADVSIVANARIIGPAMLVTKQADAAPAVANTPLGYTVTATNNGSTDLTAAAGTPAVVKDNLGGAGGAARIVQESLAATIGGVAVNAPTIMDGVLTWVGDLLAGETVEISYATEIAPDGSTGAVIENRAAALRAASLPLPEAAECTAAATAHAFNCVTVATAVANGPSLVGAEAAVAPGKSTSFDVVADLATAGESSDLTVTLIDPKTGKPTADTTITVAGGVWTLDQATGVVTFTAGEDFDGTAPPLAIRVTDANGFVADATLKVTFVEAETPDPGGPDPNPGNPDPNPEVKPTPPGLPETGAGNMLAAGGAAVLLLLAGTMLTIRRVRTR